MTDFEVMAISDRARTVTVKRGDGSMVDIDVSVIGLSDQRLTLAVYAMQRTEIDLVSIEHSRNNRTVLTFEFREDKRNG